MQAIFRSIVRPQVPAWIFLSLLGGAAASAQSVRWEPGSGQLALNQVSELTLIFEGCEPEGDLNLPQPEGLTMGTNPATGSQTSIVNGRMSRSVSYTFPIRPTSRQEAVIPAFTIRTDKGEQRVKEARFTVGETTVGRTGLTLDDISSVNLVLPRTTVWAGEVVPVTYRLSVLRRYLHQVAPNVEWQPAPLLAEQWSELRSNTGLVRGQEQVTLEHGTRVYVKEPGAVTLKPASKIASIVVGQSGFGFFSGPETDTLNFATKPVDLTVRPLPPAPAGFTGVVGEFTLSSKIVPTTPRVGEPVTWTLELTGTGNWPDITGLPQREVSNDFQVVQPKSKRTMKDNLLFEGTLSEDVVLVPTKAGAYTIAPVKFVYFNTATGSYQTIMTEPATIQVSAGAGTVQSVAPANGPVQFSLNLPSSNQAAPALPTPTAPVPPETLPRQHLSAPRSGYLPYQIKPLWLMASLPALAAVLVAWIGLAAWRARELDPEKRRRAAKAALAQTLADLRTASHDRDPQVSGLRFQVSEWQRHAASLWEVPQAAPAATQIAAAVLRRQSDQAPAWVSLWNEADRTLHGPAEALPADWIERAETALAAVSVPGWNPFSALLTRHLFPGVIASFTLLALTTPSSLNAKTGGESYAGGDFSGAEKQWRADLAATPADWATRHNLALALAQQDRWPEATAYWTGAFVQQPGSADTRAGLALGLQRSGLAPAELVSFSQGKGRFKIARHFSPGQWQLTLVGSSLLIALSLVLLLMNGYRRLGGWTKPVAFTAVLTAIVLAGFATFSLRTYGQLADPRAVFVWQASTLRSIPTEADTTQKTTPLSAGSIAIVDNTFLDSWSHLTFATGQTGWVRSEVLIPLYR